MQLLCECYHHIQRKWHWFLKWYIDTWVQVEINEGWLQNESCYVGVREFTGTSQPSYRLKYILVMLYSSQIERPLVPKLICCSNLWLFLAKNAFSKISPNLVQTWKHLWRLSPYITSTSILMNMNNK